MSKKSGLTLSTPKYAAQVAQINRQLQAIDSEVVTVTFCGKFKSGKSSLINAILGVNLLPTKATTATGVVTRVYYAKHPEAYIVYGGARQIIPFDDASKFILAKDKSLAGVQTSGVSEVGIGVNHKLLKKNLVIVDTPGLEDDPKLTHMALAQVRKSDFAIIVVNATQAFSQAERMLLTEVNEMLRGNLKVVVNRIDQIEHSDRADVKETADFHTKKLGNSLTDPKILYTSASETAVETDALKAWLSQFAKINYRNWFQRLFRLKQRPIPTLSRLSAIHAESCSLIQRLNEDVTEANERIVKTTEKSQKMIDDYRAEITERMKAIKLALKEDRTKARAEIVDSFVGDVSNMLVAAKGKVSRNKFQKHVQTESEAIFQRKCQMLDQRIDRFELNFITRKGISGNVKMKRKEIPMPKFFNWHWGWGKDDVLDKAAGAIGKLFVPELGNRLDIAYNDVLERLETYEKVLVIRSGLEDEIERYRADELKQSTDLRIAQHFEQQLRAKMAPYGNH
ncbi:MAG: hypothetical protein PWP51_1528 [Clostridiales bacterium]|nr:hypothetical protein [Clostridiales bacterium]MDN5298975.1 hypothetical protein [Clostridiales bacterium]